MLQNNPILLGLKNQFKQENPSAQGSSKDSGKDSKVDGSKNQNSKDAKTNQAISKNASKQNNFKTQSNVAKTPKTVEGKVKSSSKSYGFLETDSGEDYFITPKDMHKVFAGDFVKAKIKVRQSDGSLQAEPLEIIDFTPQKLIGKINLTSEGAKIEIEKNNATAVFELEQAPTDIENCSWVEAEFYQHLLENQQNFKFRFLRFITNKSDVWANWKLALAKQNLPVESPKASEDFLQQIRTKDWQNSTKETREDLTDLEFFTIDGSFTKDMDDAIFIEKLNSNSETTNSEVGNSEQANLTEKKNLTEQENQQNTEKSSENANASTEKAKSEWRLIVAIAEPDIYIEENSPFDQQAFDISSSIYLAGGQDISMLPKEITENLSSLVPNEIRATLACEMHISKTGELQNFRFFLAKIKSHFKLNYSQVNDFLQDKLANKIENATQSLEESILNLNALSDARIQWRKDNAIFMENSNKYYFELNSNAQVVEIKPELRLKSHQLIEESMLLANSAASKFFQTNNLEAVFINHSGYAEEKIPTLEKFLQANSIETQDLDLTTIAGYKQLQKRIGEHSDSKYIESYIRRFGSYVNFSKNAAPHFGLGFDAYTTWSSPIRKYSDLLNHRVIKQFLTNASQYFVDESIFEHLQERRRQIRFTEREVNDLLYAKYLKNREDIFEAEITGVTKGGLRVILTENGASLFVPISMIDEGSNNISCDINQAKVYKDKEEIYKLGDSIKLSLAKSNKSQNDLVGKIVLNL